jgi:hypothetical protein
MKKFTELSQLELRKLYTAYINYRDVKCKGNPKLGIKEFYKKIERIN